MTTLVPVIFVGFVLLIIGVVVVGYLQAKKRREGMAAYAASRGWTYTEQDPSLLDRFEGAPFGTGQDREAFNVMRGTAHDRPMVVFDYRYVTTHTSTDAQGHSKTERTTHPFSVIAVNTGAVMPALAVTPEGLVSRFFGRLTNSDIELESEDFNRAFTVTCPNRRFASDVLHPRMMELLLQWPELAWRFDADSVLAIRSGAHDVQEVEAKLAALDAILDAVPDFVWREVRGPMSGPVTPVAWAAVAVAVVLLLAVLVMYNRFVRQRTLVDESWGGIDVELTRRHDLIPQLVETVRGYAAHEQAVLTVLVEAREAAAAHHADSPAHRQGYEDSLGGALQQVLARVEAYPDLQASQGFLALQRELTNTEDRIAASRRFYNGNVRAYNTRVGTFPSNLVAAVFRFRPREFFELSERVAGPVAG